MHDVRFDLSAFGLSEMARCSAHLRKAADEAPSPDAAAQLVADFLYDHLIDDSGGRACPTVGVYLAERQQHAATAAPVTDASAAVEVRRPSPASGGRTPTGGARKDPTP